MCITNLLIFELYGTMVLAGLYCCVYSHKTSYCFPWLSYMLSSQLIVMVFV